jgi:proline dehydrogenase
MMDSKSEISLDNTHNAFIYKSDRALKKAHLLFSAMSYPWLVGIGTRFTKWAIRVGLPVKGLIRNTIFEQFVGGETLEETAPVVEMLSRHHVRVILDYGVEGGESTEQAFDHARDEFIRVIEYAATQQNIPFISIKVTGISRFGLLERLDRSLDLQAGTLMKRFDAALDSLSDAERAEWQRVYDRMDAICRMAADRGVGVLVDAEETWIQDPVDVLAIRMMDVHNRTKAVVFNTAQLYRHDRLSFVQDSLEAAELRGFILGIKLVRGAYMEKERQRATDLNYTSPIQPDKSSTDRDFNEAVRLCISRIEQVSLIVASHNEDSNLLTIRLMKDLGIPANHPHIHFSQLFGMSDHITFNLAAGGYGVSKYLPFGPIRDVIPYLMRRAQENTSVAGQTGRELMLIRKELNQRKTGK